MKKELLGEATFSVFNSFWEVLNYIFMKITLKIDSEIEEEELFLTNEMLENDNFVYLTVKDKEYIISVEELYFAIKTFYDLKNNKTTF